MLELAASALGFVHVGRLVVLEGAEVGAPTFSGTLIDVIHRPRGASWLWFRIDDVPVVFVVENPAECVVLVEPDPDVNLPRQRGQRWWRSDSSLRPSFAIGR